MFDRVVVINLKRKPERLEAFFAGLSEWKYLTPTVFEAVDGDKVGHPANFQSGGGAYGCGASHKRILECAIMDDVGSLCVMEDDAVLVDGFAEKADRFFSCVPLDWDMLMLGGQMMISPRHVCDGVVKSNNCQRTHCYTIRNPMMRELYKLWSSATVHCDWLLGTIQPRFNVYCPEPFLIGQREGMSDISGSWQVCKFWSQSKHDDPIILYRGTQETLRELRNRGWHNGYWRSDDDIDVGLSDMFRHDSSPVARLAGWIQQVGSESAAIRDGILVIWHPLATVDLIRKATSRPVFEIFAETVDSALAQYEKALAEKGKIS